MFREFSFQNFKSAFLCRSIFLYIRSSEAWSTDHVTPYAPEAQQMTSLLAQTASKITPDTMTPFTVEVHTPVRPQDSQGCELSSVILAPTTSQ